MRNPHAFRYRGSIDEPESEAGWFLLTDEPTEAKLMVIKFVLKIMITEVELFVVVRIQHVCVTFRVTPAMLWLNAIQFQFYCSE
jgi:hypothetical protein